MIFASLGTHPAPMDRVVEWLDALIAEGVIDGATIQAAAFRRKPKAARMVGVLSAGEFERSLQAADRIVTHGGPGTIMQALAIGRRPIVVARDPTLGEHVDDHQIRFVRWLRDRRPIDPVSSLDELRAVLSREEGTAGVPDHEGSAAARILELIRRSR